MAQYNLAQLFDFTALLEIQKKNIEAISAANKLAFEGFQAAGQRQAELFSQIAENNSFLVKDIVNGGTPEEKIAKHAELIKNNYEKSVANWQELTGIITESGKEASDIINRRFTASLTELKSTLDKSAANGKASTRKKAA